MAKVLKIADVSKDFAMKSKDVIEEFKALNIEKNSSGSVSDIEFEVFMQRMTATHQISDLEAYIDGRVTLNVAKEKKAAPAKPAAKAEPKKPDKVIAT